MVKLSRWAPNDDTMLWAGKRQVLVVDADPHELLERARIEWRRDWDAVALGFVLGVLATVVWLWL